ncbi:ATP-binding protein [Lichenibacterium ramalinae]|uniref:ATP-binding protein n=1 Tax=Lichenibacterium ramalinae TaxID=2316527 RepID=UPI00100F8620|nr:ATP-binding protein [Lichenibacterium ramalinae]
MQDSPDRDGTLPEVGETFSDPAFAGCKARGAAFVIVHPGTGAVAWANAAAATYWGAPDADALARALFGPGLGGGGWLDGLTQGVVAGRAPRLVRGGLARGFRMRARTALVVAVATTAGPLLGFAVPDAGQAEGTGPAWDGPAWDDPVRQGRASPDPVRQNQVPAADGVGPTAEPLPTAEISPAAEPSPGASLARRSQVAVLRDRLALALDGAVTLRLLWRTDADAVLTQIDADTVTRLGAPLQPGRGALPDLVAAQDPAGAARLRAALAGRSTWSGITLDLSVAGGAARVPMALSGSPVFGPGRRFAGFRGFGTLDLGRLDLGRPDAVEAGAAHDVGPEQVAAGPEAIPAEGSTAEAVPAADAVPAEAEALPAEAATPVISEAPAASSAQDRRPGALVTAANVVQLRAFQALLPGRSAAAEAPTPDVPTFADAAEPNAAEPEPPLSDDLAFQALGEALRARIGAPVRPAPDLARPEAPPTLAPDAPAAQAASPPVEDPAADPGAHLGADSADSADLAPSSADLVERLPWPVIVTTGSTPAFANAAAAARLGYATPGDLVAAGAALFVDGVAPAGEAGAPRPLALRDAAAGRVTLPARPAAVAWAGEAATLWLLDEPAPQGELPAAVPASAPDEGRSGELLDRVDDAVALLDGNGLVRRLNRRGETWFGRDATLGQSFTQLLSAESRPAALALLGEVRQGRDGAGGPPPRRDVVARPGDAPGSPMVLTLGRLGDAGFYLTLRDVTALKTAETERDRTERAHARDADRLTGLLGKVSHEIRTPLNAILGFAEVMMDERFGPLGNPRYRDYLKDIHASGTQVMALVEGLLDLSRIEAGQLDLDVAAVDVNRIVAETVAQMQPEAHRDRVIMRTSLGGRIPAVLADERSARQIVRNLLSNAVKFNEPGGQVIVSTALSDSGTVLLRVRDTGVGMSDDEIAAAMEPFGAGATAHAANGNGRGNGLGLPLTRALVGANGASMAIRSRPREGTLVEVAFPSAGTGADARRPA